nr:Arf1d [Planomonas micra]
MGLLLSRVMDKINDKLTTDTRLALVGLDNAGKTTLLYKLHLGVSVTTIPTIGFNAETVTYGRVRMNIFDVGGQEKIRPLWRQFLDGAGGVIYVVDSSDAERVTIARDELHSLLMQPSLATASVLVFANKQDMPGALSAADLSTKMGLDRLRQANWYIQPCCATTGEGLYEGLDWLSNTIRSR